MTLPNDELLRTQTIQRMLNHLNSPVPQGLTEWENNFIESITEQFQSNKRLSTKQVETLERIYDNNS